MASRYTDVDLMILKRWDEVQALRDAFDELRDRIDDVAEAALQKAAATASDKGLRSELALKAPSFSLWKPEWENRSKDPGVYLEVIDFLPSACRKGTRAHPSLWCMTDQIKKLRLKESSEDFGRALRGALPSDLVSKWSHEESHLANYPLGRSLDDVSDADRLRFISEPHALADFLGTCVDQFSEIMPAIDETLRKMTRR